MKTRLPSALTVGLILGMSATANAVTINAYLSAPDAQFAPAAYANTTVATFDSLTTGNLTTNYTVSNFGTYTLDTTHQLAVLGDNEFGNGTGNYVSLGAQSGTAVPVTLTFAAPARYFGFSYQAGDNQNGVTFYDGNSIIGRFSTASIVSLLGNRTTGSVRAVNNATYNSSQYFGKPNTTNVNTAEPYAFVNFFATNGTFTRVVFDNSNVTSTGFETDNHTISTQGQTPQGDSVFVGAVVVPEVGTMTLFGASGLLFFAAGNIRRRLKD